MGHQVSGNPVAAADFKAFEVDGPALAIGVLLFEVYELPHRKEQRLQELKAAATVLRK